MVMMIAEDFRCNVGEDTLFCVSGLFEKWDSRKREVLPELGCTDVTAVCVCVCERN